MSSNWNWWALVLQRYWEWIAFPVLTILAWKWPLLGAPIFQRIENAGARFAKQKALAVATIGLAVVIIRLSLLPWLLVRPPEIHDEFSYLFAADTFSHGRLTNPAHPMWFFLDTLHVLQHPTMQSMYPPAQGGVLAIGKLLGNPWIGVLLSMGALSAALVWMLQGWVPPRWALLGACLPLLRIAIFSYWMNSYWGGAVAAIGGCLMIGAIPRIFRGSRVSDAIFFAIGLALGANSRPFETAIVGVPAMIALCVVVLRKKRPELGRAIRTIVLPALAVLACTAAFMLYYNWRVTENPLLFPHALDDRIHLTMSNFVFQGPMPPKQFANHEFDVAYNHWERNQYLHTWTDFQRITKKKLTDFTEFFLGPALLSPLILVLPWLMLDQKSRPLIALLAIYAAGAVTVVWFNPHYAAPVFGALAVVMVQAIRHLRRWSYQKRPVGIGLTRAIAIFCLATFVVFLRQAVSDPRGPLPLGFSWYPNFDRVRVMQALDHIPGKHLVLVRYSQTHHDVAREWVYNEPDVDDAKIVWARDIPAIDLSPLLAYYRARTVWLLNADDPKPEPVPYPTPDVRAQIFAMGNASGPR